MVNELEKFAKNVRVNIITSIHAAQSGHPGGSLSCVEILTLLHKEILQEDDIFILSKGHACPALYGCFAELGIIERSELLTLRKSGSRLQGHPSRTHLPEVVTSTGSLGQGFGVACGFALAYKRTGKQGRIYCLVGEGDINEGVTLESARIAAYYNLNNLTLLIDYNQKQSDRHSLLMVQPEFELRGLGWMVESCDGHSFEQLRACLSLAQKVKSKPMAIICHTVKGKGVPAWEQNLDGLHGSVCLSDEDLHMALEAINGQP